MTDQRDRVITDPGIGPVEFETPSLRAIAGAEEVEPDGASLYYEPKPLIAISDHKTLEIATVRLSEDIDPRKLVTELRLPRSPIPPQYDSGWPQAQIALSSSQPPAAPRRRWRIPAALLTLLGALLLLVLARSVAQRASTQAGTANAGPRIGAPDALLAAPKKTAELAADPSVPAPLRTEPSAPVPSVIVFGPGAASSAIVLGPSAASSAAPSSAAPSASASFKAKPAATASAAAARTPNLLHHSSVNINPHPGTSPALSAPPAAKPKRAIY